VFSFLTPEARAQISQATGKSNLPPALNEVGPSSSNARRNVVVKSSLPLISKETAVAALNGGFMPYGDNPEKQKRYRAYLEIQAELSERPLTKVSPTPSLTDVSLHQWTTTTGIRNWLNLFVLQWYLSL